MRHVYESSSSFKMAGLNAFVLQLWFLCPQHTILYISAYMTKFRLEIYMHLEHFDAESERCPMRADQGPCDFLCSCKCMSGACWCWSNSLTSLAPECMVLMLIWPHSNDLSYLVLSLPQLFTPKFPLTFCDLTHPDKDTGEVTCNKVVSACFMHCL